MIPRKNKPTNKNHPQYNEPLNEFQRLSTTINFLNFQLKSFSGQKIHIYRVTENAQAVAQDELPALLDLLGRAQTLMTSAGDLAKEIAAFNKCKQKR